MSEVFFSGMHSRTRFLLNRDESKSRRLILLLRLCFLTELKALTGLFFPDLSTKGSHGGSLDVFLNGNGLLFFRLEDEMVFFDSTLLDIE